MKWKNTRTGDIIDLIDTEAVKHCYLKQRSEEMGNCMIENAKKAEKPKPQSVTELEIRVFANGFGLVIPSDNTKYFGSRSYSMRVYPNRKELFSAIRDYLNDAEKASRKHHRRVV